MEKQAPYSDHNMSPYAAAQMQHIALQRMQQNVGMVNFPGRLDSVVTENMPSKAEGQWQWQWQWDQNPTRVSNSMSSQTYREGQGNNPTGSCYEGQMADPKGDTEKQNSDYSRLQSHEQDMEIGYEDKPSTLTLEGLERRFLDETRKLAKEQSDAEDAENARHREKIIEINIQYQDQLSSLRVRQAKRREEFLLKEAQARLHQYQQARVNQHPTNAGPIYPCAYGGVAATEAYQAYATAKFESYRERPPFRGGESNQGAEERVPFPKGRVYNNTSAQYN